MSPAQKMVRVRALMAVTEFVHGHGMITMDPASKREDLRFPLVPASAVAKLVKDGRIADALPQLDHDGNGEPGGSEPHEPPALTGKNKAELLAIAEAEGVEADETMTNKAIVEAIETARAPADDAPPA